MQISTFIPLRDRSTAPETSTRPNAFFTLHPVGEIIRGLFLSSLLWVLLAIAVYMVYSLVLGSN